MSRRDYWTHQYETVFCIFLAVLAYLWRENSQLVYPHILYLIVLLLGLNLSAGLALKRWPAREWVSALIICANNATITAMLAYSGGRESNLWVLYLLPIYTACLLLRGREVAWITAGAISFNAVYFLFSVTAWNSAAYFELLLKSGIFVFSAAVTYEVGQREKNSRNALHEQSLKLEQAQKMEAIGRLAGGIAHDFNNLLTAILGSTHFLLESTPEKDSKFADLWEIKSASLRAAALTQQLLAFSRRQTLQVRVLDLNAVIKDTEKILRRLIREDISIEISLHQALAPIKVDPGQLGQVLMNLVVNARDAMPAGGRISIETTIQVVSEPEVYSNFSVPRGEYVAISVSDTGCGMTEEMLGHIFEPFFTTKELGRGTGLGLSTVYGIVKQSGGYILVSSELRKGTTFKIYLPPAKEPIDRSSPNRIGIPIDKGTETVLLAEDEAQVRNLARRILTQHGYKVIDAENGEQALRIAEQHTGPIDLLLTDVVMPGFSGPELSRRLKAARPQTKVLFISGYTDDTLLEYDVLRNNLPFLPKPFTPDALLRKAREILDSAGYEPVVPKRDDPAPPAPADVPA
jgi:signal transduction histidine kinase/ActR/RegA family two-component response regulator